MAECDLNVTDLEDRFNRASKYMQSLVSELNTDQLLTFYGLYKQATVGPCDISRPNWYQVQAVRKYEAWKKLGDMSQEIAMANYIDVIARVNPSWEEEAKFEESRGWTSVSKLPNTDATLKDTEKTFLDWLKEGNEAKVREMVGKEPRLSEWMDDIGLLPIHWAADRGHVEILKFLVEQGADLNSLDLEEQTPLHYAACCGHVEAVRYLLSIGADTSRKNGDGMTPKDIAIDSTKDLFC
ncbi:acyl-CoA-binding domain-containing protein 6 [Odontomachus brunneus]|uniref:acyl-CoA-binding domain-containing protein 6 n=1 Tax=Odontomachus brunneus TaxID=486640 RepID=UPI0013F208AA|nr:acyl-CoA-binding domain-containing protein 6 [Odontomachus brunneus]